MATDDLETKAILYYGTCPSCKTRTSFDLLGIQTWPEKVAIMLNVPAVQTVWQCKNCQTTLMEASLKLESA